MPWLVVVPYRYKQQVYDLAMQKRKQQEAMLEEGYRMPDSYDDPQKRSSRWVAALYW